MNKNTTVPITIRISPEKLSTGKTVYVSFCKELGIASQGDTQSEAEANVLAAARLWFETASEQEVQSKLKALRRRRSITYTAQVEVPAHGKTANAVGR